MDKFKIKTYLKYLAISPWTDKFSIPNFSTIIWILIILSIILKIQYLLFISIFFGVINYLIKEYKSGKFMHWHRQRYVYRKDE